MKRLLIAVLLSSLALPFGVRSAGAANISCVTALRLSPETFSTVYTTRAHDLSEIAQDAAYHYWGTCKQQATTRGLAGNAALASRIGTLRGLFARLQDDEAFLAILRAGGGSLYSHMGSRAIASREQSLADIATLEMSGLGHVESAEAGQLIDPTVQSIHDRLTRVQHPTTADLRFTTRAQWNKAATAYVAMARATMRAAGTRNDVTRVTILTVVNSPLFLDTPVGTP